MTKDQGHRWLHGCIAAAIIKGIWYLTKYKLSGFKGIIKTKKMPQQDLSDDMGARLNKCSTRMGPLLSGTLDHYHHAKYKQNP